METPSERFFTVKDSGWYVIKGNATLHRPTGRCRAVPNHSRKWWQFFRPRVIFHEIYEVSHNIQVDEKIYLDEGTFVERTTGAAL